MSVAAGSWVRWSSLSVVGLATAIGLYVSGVYTGWAIWLLVLLGAPGLVWTYAVHKSTRYKITTRRVEFERGVFSRELDSLELWRVLDVRYGQSLIDRIFGNAKITVVGTDRTHPQLVLHGLPNHRALFEQLRDAVGDARHTGRPLEFAGTDYEALPGQMPEHTDDAR